MKRFVYGVNVDSEDFNHITHIVVLSEEEVKGMDLDFEEFWRQYGHRAIALVPEEKEE
ncbi:MAG: hypothetical protein QXD60_03515 [Nanopusillaceae archaeon]